ncbi:MAG: hypothetical protein AAF713_21480 [Pseudomonadota bacterium]
MTYQDPDRDALKHRITVAKLSTEAPSIPHCANMDEQAPYLFSFTKGLSHKVTGLLDDPRDFETFAIGTKTNDPAPFAATVPFRGEFLPPNMDNIDPANVNMRRRVNRRWESPTSGHAYVGEGPDPHAVTMPPAPKIGSAEFAAEMAEVYEMALGRDWCTAALMPQGLRGALTKLNGRALPAPVRAEIDASAAEVDAAAARLTKMRWFEGEADDMQPHEFKKRRRHGEEQTSANLFRGIGEDDWDTPFLSQFMVMGSGGPMREQLRREEGFITYGAQRIPQTTRIARPGQDYMTGWRDWLNVQNGMNARDSLPEGAPNSEFLGRNFRPLARLRDMATYVHDDQLYQAYLNAALILLDERFPFDPGIPYHGAATRVFPFPGAVMGDNNQTPFALFGGPHLLTLVTEVSSRALKAVRLQKFTVHRRLRPEAAGALFHTVYSGYQPHWDEAGSAPYGDGGDADEQAARQMLADTIAEYTFPQDPNVEGSEPVLEEILTNVRLHNNAQNGGALRNSWLLPMAFPEGSPMHPAYGAGHATVAGACCTLLKAFFAMRDKFGVPVRVVEKGGAALVPSGGTGPADLEPGLLSVPIPEGLTLESELNKLMWNISNARNIAGVHYYTDYIESALLGEAITIGILREQMLAYHPDEQVEMTVPLLVERTLPAAILTGETDILPNQPVSAVKISSKGALLRA